MLKCAMHYYASIHFAVIAGKGIYIRQYTIICAWEPIARGMGVILRFRKVCIRHICKGSLKYGKFIASRKLIISSASQTNTNGVQLQTVGTLSNIQTWGLAR